MSHAAPRSAAPGARCPFSRFFRSEPQTALSAELKARTADAHHRAEFHTIQQRIVRGQVTPHEYAPFALRMQVVHAELESALDRAAADDANLRAVYAPRHRRAALINADLEFLGVSAGGDASCSAALGAYTQWVADALHQRPTDLLGALYVLEGSTNGGMVIARVLRRAWGLAEVDTLRSIDPHGEMTRAYWGEFRVALDALPVTDIERHGVISAAAKMFDLISALMDECVLVPEPSH